MSRYHTVQASGVERTSLHHCIFTVQGNELNYYKTRASGLDEEIKQVKIMAEAQNLQKLRDENTHFSTQVGLL